MLRCTLGVDVGGTFTDLVLIEQDSGRLHYGKVPSTPQRPDEAVAAGIAQLCQQSGVPPVAIAFFIHGTTVATNALLQRRGARVALLVTAGFRDVLHIVRQDRPRLYDLRARRPPPLVPRHLTFEVHERLRYDGTVHTPLDLASVDAAASALRAEGVTSVAVCLLHSYANPAHERAVRDRLLAVLPDLHVTLSSDVAPEIKEYERTSTTVISAYVRPAVAAYLARVEEALARSGVPARLHVMQSSGGVMTARAAGERAAQTILSGPAAGAIGGLALARACDRPNAITVDMGGTSFDVCLAYGGTLHSTREGEIAGHAVRVPMIDIHTIGAGGGSIARLDRGGALVVGPESAGADPGPACYDKGGSAPTVTDANLVLGRVPDRLLGGAMRLERALAERAIRERLAAPWGATIEQAAAGIIAVVNAAMARAMRLVSVGRGYDPRDFVLVCFGGGGPLHGAALAAELGIPELIVPPHPGVTSALGLLLADFRFDYVRAYLRPLAAVQPAELAALFAALEAQALDQMRAEGVADADVRLLRSVDLRYLGQGYELEVPLPGGPLGAADLARLAEDFGARHKRAYGYQHAGSPLQVVNLRVVAVGALPKPALRAASLGPADPSAALVDRRAVYVDGAWQDVPVYDRARLAPGHAFTGPAIVEQFDSTTLVGPGQRAWVDGFGNLRLVVAAAG
jgi:N-methylhydantoinase A